MIKNVKLAASFVGQGTARILADAGVRIVAVTDQYGGVSSMTGLDIGALERQAQDHRTVVGSPGAWPISNDGLRASDVDLLVPTAVEGVLNEGNAGAVRARIIVEGANGPTTPGADEPTRTCSGVFTHDHRHGAPSLRRPADRNVGER